MQLYIVLDGLKDLISPFITYENLSNVAHYVTKLFPIHTFMTFMEILSTCL